MIRFFVVVDVDPEKSKKCIKRGRYRQVERDILSSYSLGSGHTVLIFDLVRK